MAASAKASSGSVERWLPEQYRDRVVEHGFLPHDKFLPLLGSMRVNLQLSYTESFGRTYCESWRWGVPCVASPAVRPLERAPLTASRPDDLREIVALIREAAEMENYVIDEVNARFDGLAREHDAAIASAWETMRRRRG